MTTDHTDVIQDRITAIMLADTTLATTLQQLGDLEPMIVDYYNRGLTEVKPVSMMTADDLCGA